MFGQCKSLKLHGFVKTWKLQQKQDNYTFVLLS